MLLSNYQHSPNQNYSFFPIERHGIQENRETIKTHIIKPINLK